MPGRGAIARRSSFCGFLLRMKQLHVSRVAYAKAATASRMRLLSAVTEQDFATFVAPICRLLMMLSFTIIQTAAVFGSLNVSPVHH